MFIILVIRYNLDCWLVCNRDWRGAGCTRVLPRGGVGRSLEYFFGAVRVYNIDCGAGPRAVSYCGHLRACIAYLRSNAIPR